MGNTTDLTEGCSSSGSDTSCEYDDNSPYEQLADGIGDSIILDDVVKFKAYIYKNGLRLNESNYTMESDGTTTTVIFSEILPLNTDIIIDTNVDNSSDCLGDEYDAESPYVIIADGITSVFEVSNTLKYKAYVYKDGIRLSTDKYNVTTNGTDTYIDFGQILPLNTELVIDTNI